MFEMPAHVASGIVLIGCLTAIIETERATIAEMSHGR